MRGMCAAMLSFEAIVLGLATPVMIAVEDVDTIVSLVVGLGLALSALVIAGLLRWSWAYNLGHALQIAAIALALSSVRTKLE